MNFSDFKKIALVSKEGKIAGDIIYRLERSVSVRCSWFLYKFFPSIKPNHITGLSFLLLLLVLFLTVYIWALPLHPTILFIIGLGLLYIISILDKIDGELARVKDYATQKGLYYDRSVHFVFPLILYLLIATHFMVFLNSGLAFYMTIILGLMTQQFIFFREARLLIGEKIKVDRIVFRDLVNEITPKKPRPMLVVRLLDYTTFMIYSFTLFYYIGISLVGFFYMEFAIIMYIIHLVISLIVNIYKVYISYPKRKLYSQDQANDLLNHI